MYHGFGDKASRILLFHNIRTRQCPVGSITGCKRSRIPLYLVFWSRV